MKLIHRSTLGLTTFCAAMLLAGTLHAADAPSGLAVRDVRLMVEQQWRWTAEMKPGEDNPGSGTVVRVPEPIPANGRVQFRYDLPEPLPQRTDGHFETAVRVLSFSEHWYEPTSNAPQVRVVTP